MIDVQNEPQPALSLSSLDSLWYTSWPITSSAKKRVPVTALRRLIHRLQIKDTANRTWLHSLLGHRATCFIYKADKISRGVQPSPSSDFYLALTMSLILSSPAKHTRNSAGRYSATDKPPIKKLCDDMDDEMRRCFLGPMPIKEFFRKFLPIRKKPSGEEKAALPGFESIAEVKKENEMYDKFVRCFHRPVCFTSLIVARLLGRHYRLLFQYQGGKLVKGSRDRIRRELQAGHRFL